MLSWVFDFGTFGNARACFSHDMARPDAAEQNLHNSLFAVSLFFEKITVETNMFTSIYRVALFISISDPAAIINEIIGPWTEICPGAEICPDENGGGWL